MTDEVNSNDTVNVDMDDLDAFESAFYNRKVEEVEDEVEVDETESDQLATETDEDAPEEEETPEEDEGEDEVEEPEEDPKPKAKNRKSAKERIEELVAEAREAQRERDALKREFESLKQQVQKPVIEEAPLSEQLPPEAPKPDAVNDKGELVYKLGEFDPMFIRDLTRFTIEAETKAIREEEAKKAAEQRVAEEQAKLSQTWREKVTKIQEELPDFKEKVSGLTEAFQGIDPQYGDYLAQTIMSCDNGPEIMYYLSQNIGEAQNIVASGPFAATLTIGKLQARLERPVETEEVEEPRNKVRVSDAPKPPEMRVRGNGGKFSVRPDTDDLDAFERVYFKK